MGRADLACAECNCFLRLMVNLRPAVLSDSPPPNHPPPAAQGRHLGAAVVGYAARVLRGMDPRFPHLKNESWPRSWFPNCQRGSIWMVLQSGCPGKI